MGRTAAFPVPLWRCPACKSVLKNREMSLACEGRDSQIAARSMFYRDLRVYDLAGRCQEVRERRRREANADCRDGRSLAVGGLDLPAVVSLDVIERVHDPDAYLAEIDRILQPGGRAASQWSLTSSFGGWAGCRDPCRRRMSGGGAERSLFGHGPDKQLPAGQALPPAHLPSVQYHLSTIPEAHIAYVNKAKGKLARLFNTVSQSALLRPLFLVLSPLFWVTGAKVRLH